MHKMSKRRIVIASSVVLVLVAAPLALMAWGRSLVYWTKCDDKWVRGIDVLSVAGRFPVLGAHANDIARASASRCVGYLAIGCDMKKSKARDLASAALHTWLRKALSEATKRGATDVQPILDENNARQHALDWRPFVSPDERTTYCASWESYFAWARNNKVDFAEICSYCLDKAKSV